MITVITGTARLKMPMFWRQVSALSEMADISTAKMPTTAVNIGPLKEMYSTASLGLVCQIAINVSTFIKPS